MLPSFRLIAATFLCSFLIAFVGLRLAATSRVGSETTGIASNQLPLQLTGADAAADMRRLDRNAPVVFDLRFAVGATTPAVPSGLTLHAIDRAKRESGIDFPEQPTVAPAIAPEPLEPAAEVKPEPKIEVAALPEPTAAAADAPPPPPGPSAAVAAIESKPDADIESVGSTEPTSTVQAASAKPAIAKAKRKIVKKKAVKRARAKQAAQTDLNTPVFNPFPNNP